MGTTPLTIRLDEKLKLRLEEEAEREDRSVSSLVVHAIRQMLEEQEAKRRLVEAALAEAARGEFISEKAVTAWFTSLDTEEELPEPQPDVTVGH